jgi:hypothetical protein
MVEKLRCHFPRENLEMVRRGLGEIARHSFETIERGCENEFVRTESDIPVVSRSRILLHSIKRQHSRTTLPAKPKKFKPGILADAKDGKAVNTSAQEFDKILANAMASRDHGVCMYVDIQTVASFATIRAADKNSLRPSKGGGGYFQPNCQDEHLPRAGGAEQSVE